ncbi:MAG: phosphoenolpyruvate--protein phosphotransferase [Oscillospiraceae bacterium]
MKIIGKANAMIFESHETILDDEELIKKIKDIIKELKCNAEYAIFKAAEYFSNMLKNVEDEYIQVRANDVKEICLLLVENMHSKGNNHKLLAKSRNSLLRNQGLIVTVPSVFVSDVIAFFKLGVKGFITQNGCEMSHSSILAQSLGLGLVALVGTGCNLEWLINKELLISGPEAAAFVEPEERTVKFYLKQQQEYYILKQRQKSIAAEEKNLTKDDVEIKLMANINSVNDIKEANKNGAQGVGLFRSEYLFINGVLLPTEDEQFEVYKQLLLCNKGKPVVIRTLDIGFDKIPDYYKNMFPKTPSAFGIRGICFCLQHIDIFTKQLRALLRASVYGRLRIMLPMISFLDEVTATKELIAKIKQEFIKADILFGKDIKLGVMVETPAAVMIVPELANHVDFFSIGTNDLLQFTFAMNKDSENMQNEMANNNAVIRMIKLVTSAANKKKISVSVCGACAGYINFLGSLV